MQRERRRFERGRHFAQRAAACDGVLLPPELPDNAVARREACVVALDYLTDALRGDHVADLHRLRVGARFAHPSALVRVDRGVREVDEHLARAGAGDVDFLEREV